MIKNHMEGPQGFRVMLAEWVQFGYCDIVGDEIRFYNGSKIYLCHCKDEKHRFKYQGAEIHLLLIDELTHFTELIYRFLRNRVRMVGIKVPKSLEGLFPRIVASGNPGNIGHLFVKNTFIDKLVPLEIKRMEPREGGMLRQFIPAKLEDNPSMTEHDPLYVHRLEGLGSAELVKAMRHGDWDVVEGAFFDCWSSSMHVLRPFEVPKEWPRFISGDWGSARPFSFGWWAVVSDDYQHDGMILPRGALIRYREWYGMEKDKPNTGLKLTSEQVGAGLKKRNIDKVMHGVLDPAAFAEDGGPSHAERILKSSGIAFRRADNKRVPTRGAMGGWDMMRQRFIGIDPILDEHDKLLAVTQPMIYVFSTCRDSIRTIPVLQHDDLRPEDLDTNGEDHAADEWRYVCMSRPWSKPVSAGGQKPRDAYQPVKEEEDNEWQTA